MYIGKYLLYCING